MSDGTTEEVGPGARRTGEDPGTGDRDETAVERTPGAKAPARAGRWSGSFRRSWLVARTNLRRQYRTARAHPWLGFAYLFSLTFGLFVTVGRAPMPGFRGWPYEGGYALGGRLAAGDPTALSQVRGFAGVLFVLLVLVTVMKEATDGAMDTHVDALVLTAGTRSVAVGGVLWSLLLTGSQFGVIVLAGAAAFGVGAASPAAGVGLGLAGGALLVTAVPVGYALATAVRLAFQRVPLLREHRVLVGAPLAVAYFGLFARARESMTLLADSPPSGFADLGLAVVGAGGLERALSAAGLVLVGGVGGTLLSVPLSVRLWLRDEPAPTPESETTTGEETATGGGAGPLARLVGRPTAAVARSVWLRVRREPRALVFAAMSAGIAGTVAVDVVARVPAALPVVVAVYGAATVGMGATLNPLGAAGVGLPAALTTPGGGRALVRGLALSAALPGVPLVAGLALVSGLAAGLAAPLLGGVVAVAVALTAASSLVSLVVGLAVPNVEGLRPTGSGLRPPKLLATTVFLLGMALLGTPALVGVGVGGVTATTGTALGGLAASAGLGVVAAAVAYRRALRRTTEYSVE